jgi:hypothetical protein
MIRFLALILIVFILIGGLSAGVIKETKTSVTFKGFGKYTTTGAEKITIIKKTDDKKSDFAGEGIMGKMTGKLFFRPGSSSEITNLDLMKIFTIDHAKKEYHVRPIEKIQPAEQDTEESETEETAETEEEQSNIRVIRSEFKVNATGEKKTINSFPCQRFDIFWVTEWENIETKERHIDSLLTVLWTTALNSDLKKAQDEEMKFNQEYLKRIGLDMEKMQKDVLGLQWITLLKQMDPKNRNNAEIDNAQFVKEMQKIEGYPIVTDGKYYVINPQQQKQQQAQAQEQEEERQSGPPAPPSMNKMFGGLMKKAVKKEEKPKQETGPPAALEFYTELIKYQLQDVAAAEFGVPAGYKEVTQQK